jgi:hypothetical protein
MRNWLGFALIAITGCTGEIDVPINSPGGGPNGKDVCRKVASPGTKLVRLTHAQYDNTVRDLLGLTVSPSAAFQKDPTFQGFNNNALGLNVADRLGRDYRRSAEDLGLQVVTTPAARARVVPCAGPADDCARTFIASFGRKAFRRPLTQGEQDAFFLQFKKADAVLEGTDPFNKGVQLVVESMLQMPQFLYRVELAESAPVSGMVPLTSFEIASRLSYMLWNTTPDPVLLDLAELGKLGTPAEVKAKALSMLDDPRAQKIVDDFHHQWLDLDKYNNLTRDPALFPSFSPALSPMMQQETLRFVNHVVFEEKAPFASLFTAPYTFVNRELAALYKLTGSYTTAAYTRVDLDPTQRAGLLTQTGFLASHAYTRIDSPIHRGVFMIRRILCLPLGDPPGNADLNLPAITGDIKTTRQQVTVHTSPAGCAGCHTRINSMGFAFGNYDAVGQYRTMDNGVAVDASGSIALGGKMHSFTNAIEFAKIVSQSEEARGCYARNWMRYAYQRADAAEDGCDIEAMTRNLGRADYSVKEMIGDLTQNNSFRYRSAEELP